MDAVIDIDALSAPLSEDSPCGEDPRDDVRFDSPYQQLRNLREEAMSGERVNRSAMDDEESSDSYKQSAAWQAVVDQAVEIISSETKDLEVCALLIEGLVRSDGIAGLRDGLRLAARLVSDFWDTINPPLDPNDEDSLEDRIAAFNGLDGANQPGTVARYIPRLEATGAGYDDFQCYQVAQAFGDGESSSDLPDILEAARKSPMAFYVDLVADIEGCEEALAEMDAAFTEVCGYEGPSVGRIREALESFGSTVRMVGKDQLELAAAKEAAGEELEEGEAGEGGEGGAVATGGGGGGGAGPIQNRSDALRRLRIVADYFRKTEPHSPLSYSMENLLRWADLPLDKLILEWIPDETAREHFQLMTGVQRADAAGDEYESSEGGNPSDSW